MDKDSNDILTKYNLLTEECDLETGRGWSSIDLGVISREKHSKLFGELAEIFLIPKKTNEVSLTISNAYWFGFFNDDDKVDPANKDAPQLSITPYKKGFENVFASKYVSLSNNDAICLSKYLISYYMDIVNDLKRVETELK